MNPVKEFVSYVYSKSPQGFSYRIEKGYSQIIDWIKSEEPRAQGFDIDEKTPDLRDSKPYSTAQQFFWYFQTHNAKAYYSLLDFSDELVKRKKISWLDIPRLCILDIGAGTGAATIALLDLLCEYYEYRWSKGYVVSPKEVNIVAVEPNQFAIKILQNFLQIFRPELKHFQICLNLTLIQEKFPYPKCISSIKEKWHLKKPHTLIAISSNVMAWTQDKFIGQREAKAYKDLLGHYGFRQIFLLDIVTRNRTSEQSLFQSLVKKIKNFVSSFTQVKESIDWWEIEEEATVSFLNAPNTFFGQKSIKQKEVNYFHSLRGNAHALEESDSFWEKALDNENLKLAWIRTRQHMLHDDLVDEVEIRLVDFFWTTYLERLHRYLVFEQYNILDTQDCLAYAGPKNLHDNRPRYLLRVREQIVSAALSQANPHAFEPIDAKFVFGYRLNKEKTEYFYEAWLNHFDDYTKSINKIPEHSHIICKLDIKSFYANISQNRLYHKLCDDIGIESCSQLQQVIQKIVIRNLNRPYHRDNFGLPQSGITAGLWANSYLQDVDKLMLKDGNVPIAYFCRYVDDMTIVAEENKIDTDPNFLC